MTAKEFLNFYQLPTKPNGITKRSAHVEVFGTDEAIVDDIVTAIRKRVIDEQDGGTWEETRI